MPWVGPQHLLEMRAAFGLAGVTCVSARPVAGDQGLAFGVEKNEPGDAAFRRGSNAFNHGVAICKPRIELQIDELLLEQLPMVVNKPRQHRAPTAPRSAALNEHPLVLTRSL